MTEAGALCTNMLVIVIFKTFSRLTGDILYFRWDAYRGSNILLSACTSLPCICILLFFYSLDTMFIGYFILDKSAHED